MCCGNLCAPHRNNQPNPHVQVDFSFAVLIFSRLQIWIYRYINNVRLCSYHTRLKRFPKNEHLNQQWRTRLGVSSEHVYRGLICSEHFVYEDFKRKNKSELKPNAIPSIFKAREYGKSDDGNAPSPQYSSLLDTNEEEQDPGPNDNSNNSQKHCKKCVSKEDRIEKDLRN